jgi:hypothetical protein
MSVGTLQTACCVGWGWHMARPRRNAAGDSLLHGFYESFGLAPRTIERAIELRYSEPPPRTYPRHSDIAKRMRHEPVAPKMRLLK